MTRLWQIQIKIANLPNYHNSIYEALRSATKNPKLQKDPKGDEISEWVGSDQVALKYLIGNLAIRYIECYQQIDFRMPYTLFRMGFNRIAMDFS